MTDLTLALKITADNTDSSAKLKLTNEQLEKVNVTAVNLSNPGAKSFITQMDTAHQSALKLKEGVTAVTVGVASLATIAVGALTTGKFVEINKEVEGLNASLKTVTGSIENAGIASRMLTDFAQTTPFNLNQVTEAFVRLKSIGLDASEASLRSYGNTASAMNKSLLQYIEAVADATTGEFERLKEFGIKASVEGDKVTFTFRGVSTTVQKESSAIEGYLRKIGDTDFSSGMEDQAKTIGGQLSNLEDQFQKFVVFIGNLGLNDVIKKSIGGATQVLQDFQTGLDAVLGNSARSTYDAYLQKITQLRQEIESGRPNVTLFGGFEGLPGAGYSDAELAQKKQTLADMEAQLEKLRTYMNGQQAADAAKLGQITAGAPPGRQRPVDDKAAAKAQKEAEREMQQAMRAEEQANRQRLNDQRAFAEASYSVDKDLFARQQAELKSSFDQKRITAEEYYKALQDVRLADINAEIDALKLKQQATQDNGDIAKLDAQIIILERQRGDVARDTANTIAKAQQDERESVQALVDKYDIAGAAIRKAQADAKTLYEGFDKGLINGAAFDKSIKGIQDGLDTTLSKGKDLGDGLSEFAVQGARSMQSAFADFLFDPFAKGTQSMGEMFLQTIRRMAANAASAMIMDSLFGKGFASSSGSSNGLGGIVGTAGKAIFSSIFHEGGVVGLGGSSRQVNSLAFIGAPRYHTGGLAGLMPGEVPAILKAGEEVLTANDPRHVANGGAGVTVNVYEAPGTKATVQQNGNQISVIIQQVSDYIADQTQRGGGLAPVMEGRYGLNPAAGAAR